MVKMEGIWKGYYEYGPNYGSEFEGEIGEFMLFLKDTDEGFEGESVDFEGTGTDFDKASIKGFVRDGIISFIKQYNVQWSIDEKGNRFVNHEKRHPEIHYEGFYDKKKRTFSGKWDMVLATYINGEYLIEDLCSGSWEMKKEE
jgi:hypothetical protein